MTYNSFSQILITYLEADKSNYSKFPKLARNADGSYYLKEA